MYLPSATCCDTWLEKSREEVDSEQSFNKIIAPEIRRFCREEHETYVMAIGAKGVDYIIGTSLQDVNELISRARDIAEHMGYHRIYIRYLNLDAWKYGE